MSCPATQPILHVPQSFAQSGRKLGYAVLFFVLCTILVVTLEPFDFHVPRHVHLTGWDGPFDVVANVALFMIPGFLFALTRQATSESEAPSDARRRTLQRAFVYSVLISGTIETIQAFEPARYPSLYDVISNTTGACLGAWVFLRISRLLRADTPLVGMLALELPLMGLVYLLVPLCMLASMTQTNGALRTGLAMSPRAYGLLALACFVGVLLGHLQRNRFGPQGLARPYQTAAAAAGSFIIGAMPALPANPLLVAMGAFLSGCVTWCVGAIGLASTPPADRRFEATALRRGAPFFLSYVALASFATPPGSVSRPSRIQIISDVESYAAFTVFGFMLAEGWGRLELRYRWVVAYVGTVCLATACAIRTIQHVSPFTLSTLVAIGAHALAGAYGGWIYHLQRAHVRLLATAQKSASSERTSMPRAHAGRHLLMGGHEGVSILSPGPQRIV